MESSIRDGEVILPESDDCFRQRHRLAAAGHRQRRLRAEREGRSGGHAGCGSFGLPQKDADNRAMDEVVDRALFDTLDSLPKAKKGTPTPPARR